MRLKPDFSRVEQSQTKCWILAKRLKPPSQTISQWDLRRWVSVRTATRAHYWICVADRSIKKAVCGQRRNLIGSSMCGEIDSGTVCSVTWLKWSYCYSDMMSHSDHSHSSIQWPRPNWTGFRHDVKTLWTVSPINGFENESDLNWWTDLGLTSHSQESRTHFASPPLGKKPLWPLFVDFVSILVFLESDTFSRWVSTPATKCHVESQVQTKPGVCRAACVPFMSDEFPEHHFSSSTLIPLSLSFSPPVNVSRERRPVKDSIQSTVCWSAHSTPHYHVTHSAPLQPASVSVSVCVSARKPHSSTLTFHTAQVWNVSGASKLSLVTPSHQLGGGLGVEMSSHSLGGSGLNSSPPSHTDWSTRKGQRPTHPRLLQVIVVAKRGGLRRARWLQTIFPVRHGPHYTWKSSSAELLVGCNDVKIVKLDSRFGIRLCFVTLFFFFF